jgi:hypothetical protein
MDTVLSLVYATPQLLVVLLCTMFTTLQSLDTLLWFVYMSLQSVVNQLLSLEIGGSCSELHLSLALGHPTPLVVNVMGMGNPWVFPQV